MGYTSAGLDAGLNGRASAGARITFHTADPGTTGANEITGTGRPATTWGAAEADGAGGRRRVGSQVAAPIPAGTTVTHWGISSAATGGTFLGGWALAQPESFGADGEIRHTPTLTDQNG